MTVKPAQERLDAQARAIRRRYVDDGVGYIHLATEFGVSLNSMREWISGKPWRRSQAEANRLRHQQKQDAENVERDTAIVAKRAAGVEIAHIAADLGISYKTVYVVLKRAGMTKSYGQTEPRPVKPKLLRGQARMDDLREDVEAWIKEGRTGAQIAEEAAVSESTVYKWLEANGLKLRRAQALTPLQSAIIDCRTTAGLRPAAIARRLNCSKHAVMSTLVKAGLIERRGPRGRPPGSNKEIEQPPLEPQPPRKKGPKTVMTDETVRLARILLGQGMTQPDVCDRIGISRQTLNNHMHRILEKK